jgi:hypothetical protein
MRQLQQPWLCDILLADHATYCDYAIKYIGAGGEVVDIS